MTLFVELVETDSFTASRRSHADGHRNQAKREVAFPDSRGHVSAPSTTALELCTSFFKVSRTPGKKQDASKPDNAHFATYKRATASEHGPSWPPRAWDRIRVWQSWKNTGENGGSSGRPSRQEASRNPSLVRSRTSPPRPPNAHACPSRNCHRWRSTPGPSMATRSWFRSTGQRGCTTISGWRSMER